MHALLRTDAYKLAMAQAGFPLRRESFYLSFRRGGWHLLPFDLAARVRALVADLQNEPPAARAESRSFAASHGYDLDDAMRATATTSTTRCGPRSTASSRS